MSDHFKFAISLRLMPVSRANKASQPILVEGLFNLARVSGEILRIGLVEPLGLITPFHRIKSYWITPVLYGYIK